MSRPHALIFDFGNVIAHFDYARAAARFGRSLGISAEEFLSRSREAGFVEVLKAYESGELTSEAFHQKVCELTGLDADFDRFAADWADIFWANEPVHRLIDGFRGIAYALVLGSNTNEIHAGTSAGSSPRSSGVSTGSSSRTPVGRIKPDARFFLACARGRGTAPGQVYLH